MHNTKTKMITLLLLAALTLAAFPLAVFASTGNIYINPASLTPPINSALNQHYAAGSAVNLYFGGVTFSGGQFILYLSTNGFSDIVTRNNQPDIPYSATFDVVNLTDTVATHVYTLPNGLTWTIGSGWVNGSIPTAIAGGSYFIKAFDGSQTSVAVTDTSLIVDPGVTVMPTMGNAGLMLTFSGSAFTLGSLLNLSYNIGAGAPVYFQNLTAVGSIGNFSVTIPAPDAMQAAATGENAIVSTVINFAAAINGTTTVVETTVDFTEFARGLVQMRVTGTGGAQQNAAAGNVFGNNTVATLTGVGVTKTLRFAGNYFYPGALTTRWDNAPIDNTSPTINGTGWFNTTLTVPPATNGLHNITFTDGNGVVFTVFVTVVPSISLSPTSGPVGTTVTATGYGFTASTTGTAVNASIAWPGITRYRGSAFTDASGSFVITFTVPNSLGGQNTVAALENATGSFVQIATATFTVTANFAVSPGSFVNNASLLVTASGGGFKAGSVYIPDIDNVMLGFLPINGAAPWQSGIMADADGLISFKFVGAGFAVGTHVVSLYENGTTTPAVYAGFNVTGDPLSSTALLEQINQTVTQTNTTVTGMNANVTAIRGTLTTIQGNIATIMTSTGTTIPATLSSIQATLTSIQNSIATIGTPNLGGITSSLSAIDAKISSLQGNTATIMTTVGTLTTSLESIDAKVTSIETAVGGIATIETDLGTLTGTVTSLSGNVATIQTTLGTIQTDISGLETGLNTVQTDVASSKSASESLSPLIIVAIVLALIAAIAAIASIVLMRRKIAG